MSNSNTSKGRAEKGSKFWMQTVIEKPELRQKLDLLIGEPLEWISPLAGEKKTYDEYKLNHRFVCEKIGISNKQAKDLFSFWPTRQPQWDGIAFSLTGKTMYLVEAKAHLSELKSRLSSTNAGSRALILKTMEEVKTESYPNGNFECWIKKYYQLGNRLSFLKKLNEKPFGIIESVKLVILNFVNDKTYLPTSEQQWQEHYPKVWLEMIGNTTVPQDVILLNYDVNL